MEATERRPGKEALGNREVEADATFLWRTGLSVEAEEGDGGNGIERRRGRLRPGRSSGDASGCGRGGEAEVGGERRSQREARGERNKYNYNQGLQFYIKDPEKKNQKRSSPIWMEASIPSPPHATIPLDDIDGHLLAPDLDGRAQGQQEEEGAQRGSGGAAGGARR